MQIDVEGLLQPVSEAEPAGPDLSYDPDFRRISRELDDIAQKERPSDDPGIGAALETAVALLGRSKDIWIASHGFCYALYNTDFEACAGLTDVMAAILERMWDTCHPVLDEGSDPAGGRREACRQLASVGRVVKHFERLYLPPLKAKGRISFKDIMGTAPAETKVADLLNQAPEQLRRAIDDSDAAGWSLLSDQLTAILSNSKRIGAAFGERAAGQGPDLGPFDAAFGRLRDFAAAVLARKNPATAPGDAESDAAAGDGGGVSSGPAVSGPIRSSAQAVAALDAVVAFLRQTEPSSPVPYLIERAKRLIGLDFMQIIENVAPTALDEAGRLLQPPPPPEPPQE